MKIKPAEWLKLAPVDRYILLCKSSKYVKGDK